MKDMIATIAASWKKGPAIVATNTSGNIELFSNRWVFDSLLTIVVMSSGSTILVLWPRSSRALFVCLFVYYYYSVAIVAILMATVSRWDSLNLSLERLQWWRRLYSDRKGRNDHMETSQPERKNRKERPKEFFNFLRSVLTAFLSLKAARRQVF